MTDRHLFECAVKALDAAYAPYSGYRVGACALSEDGRLFSGCNVENASYGATICAERTAITKGVSEGARRFTAIAVAGDADDAWPCGICRQFLNEFSQDMRVICGSRASGTFTVVPLSRLLPRAFGPEALSKA
jgi:cytidine deaminase